MVLVSISGTSGLDLNAGATPYPSGVVSRCMGIRFSCNNPSDLILTLSASHAVQNPGYMILVAFDSNSFSAPTVIIFCAGNKHSTKQSERYVGKVKLIDAIDVGCCEVTTG